MREAFRRMPSIDRRIWLAALFAVFGTTCRADWFAGDYRLSSVFRFNDQTGAELPGIPAGTAGLESAAGVAVGANGHLYVSSLDSGEILHFDAATGTPLPSPISGGRDGLFANLRNEINPNGAPGPLKIGPDHNLYVSDYGGSRLRKFDAVTGQELASAATGLGPPGGFAWGPDGDLYVGNFGGASVVKVHNGVQSFFILPGGPMKTPSSLLFLPNGDLLIASMFANAIHRFSSTGTFLGVFAAIDPIPPPIDGTNYPSDLAVDQDGNVVLAVLGPTNPPDNRGQILKYALNEGSVAGTLIDTLVDEYPPLSSLAWIRPADAIPGDYNSDGEVNDDDFAKWRADFGKWVAKAGGADGNGDGVVDAADYALLRNMMSSQGASLVSIVPEPTSWILLVGGGSIATISVRRQKRVRG
jgi:outer membrane protein assembly factor BamB